MVPLTGVLKKMESHRMQLCAQTIGRRMPT